MTGSRFVEVEGGRLYVEEAGSGDPVVFLHPGLWDSRTWDPQFASFAERYRVLRLDARGYGRSSRPEPGVPYSHARDLLAVFDDAGIERAAIVGCSKRTHAHAASSCQSTRLPIARKLGAPSTRRKQ